MTFTHLRFTRRKRSLHALSFAAALLMGGAAQAQSGNLTVSMTGTTRAVSDGQAIYIVEVRNSGNVAVSGASLRVTVPSSLTDIFWDCNSVTNVGSCGSNTSGTQSGNDITLSGLNLPVGSEVLRFTVQGRVNGTGNLSATAQLTGDSDLAGNTASLSTAVLPLPSGCTNFNEIQLVDSRAGLTTAWPLDGGNSLSAAVTGGIATSTPITQGALQYRPDISFGSPPASQRTRGNFTYTVTFARPVPAREVFLSILDVNIANPTLTVEVSGGASTANFVPVTAKPLSSTVRHLAFSSTSGNVYRQIPDTLEGTEGNSVRGDLNLMGTGNELVQTIRVTGVNVGTDDIGFNVGAQVGCADPTVRLLGTAQTVQDGQATYVLEAYDTEPVSQVFSRFARNVELLLNLPSSLGDILWDCHSTGEASCGTETTGNNAGQTLRVTGLTLPEGGLSAGSVRLVAQGRATATGNIQADGSVTAPNDTVANNAATLTTAVAPFPSLCPNVAEIQRVDSSAAVTPWPMDPSNNVRVGVSGGISPALRGESATALKYRSGIELSTPPNSQRTANNFSYTLTFDRPVPAKEIFFSILDVNVGAPNITVNVSGGATAANFAPVLTDASGPESTSGGVLRPLAYDSTGISTGSQTAGRTYRQVTRAQQDIATNPYTVRNAIRFMGQGEEPVSSITISGTNVNAGDEFAFNYGAQARCAVYSVSKALTSANGQAGDAVLKVTDTGSGTSAAPLTYAITVTNTGSAPGTNVTTTDLLPARLTYSSSEPPVAAPAAGQPVTFTESALGVGESRTYTVTAQPSIAADTVQSPLSNVASSTSADPFVIRANSNTVATDVLYLKLRKEVRNTTSATFGTTATGQAGDTLEYCIDATNYGSLTVDGAVVRDSIAATTTPNLDGYGAGLGIRQTVGGTQSFRTSTGADTDGGSLAVTGGVSASNPGLLTTALGTLAPGETARTCFQATINKRQ